MKRMTYQEWICEDPDFKAVLGGIKYVVEFVDGEGAKLVPVEIIDPPPE